VKTATGNADPALAVEIVSRHTDANSTQYYTPLRSTVKRRAYWNPYVGEM